MQHTLTSIFKNLALIILPSLWCYIPCWSPVSLWCQSPSTWCYPLLLTCFTLVSISPQHGVIPCCSPVSLWCQSPLTVVLSLVAHPFHFVVNLPSPWCYPLLLTHFILLSVSPHHGVIPCWSPISFWCQSPLTMVLSPVAHPFHFGVNLPSLWCYPSLLTCFILSISPHCGVIPCCSPVSFWCQSPLTMVLSPVDHPFHFVVNLPSPWCYPLLLTHFILVSISPHHGVIPCCSPISFCCQSPRTVVLSPVAHPFHFGVNLPSPWCYPLLITCFTLASVSLNMVL